MLLLLVMTKNAKVMARRRQHLRLWTQRQKWKGKGVIGSAGGNEREEQQQQMMICSGE